MAVRFAFSFQSEPHGSVRLAQSKPDLIRYLPIGPAQKEKRFLFNKEEQ